MYLPRRGEVAQDKFSQGLPAGFSPLSAVAVHATGVLLHGLGNAQFRIDELSCVSKKRFMTVYLRRSQSPRMRCS